MSQILSNVFDVLEMKPTTNANANMLCIVTPPLNFIDNTIKELIKDPEYDFNLYLFVSCLTQTSRTERQIMNVINSLYENLSEILSSELSEHFNSNYDDRHAFFDIKDNHTVRTNSITTHMKTFFSKIYGDDSKTFPYFISNLIFYTTMFKVYNTINDRELDIFEYLTKVDNDFEYFERYYTFANRYNGFVWSITSKTKKSNDDNNENNNSNYYSNYGVIESGHFRTLEKFDKEYVTMIVDKIDSLIMSYRKTSKDNSMPIESITNNIVKYINMCRYLSDPVQFLNIYHVSLQNRLFYKTFFDKQVKIDDMVFQTFIKSIFSTDKECNDKIKTVIELISRCIEDKLSRTRINKTYRAVPLKFETKNHDIIDSFKDSKRKNIIHNVYDSKAWNSIYGDTSNIVLNAKHHPVIAKHLSVFGVFYGKQYQNFYKISNNDHTNSAKSYKLITDERNSKVTVRITIGKKRVLVIGTVIQINILYKLIKEGDTTIQVLCHCMGVNPKSIYNEINSLILSDIVSVVKNEDVKKSILKINTDYDTRIKTVNLVKCIEDLIKINEGEDNSDSDDYSDDSDNSDYDSDYSDNSDNSDNSDYDTVYD